MSERERFVPQRVGELTEQLSSRLVEGDLSEEGPVVSEQFRSFSRLVAGLFHFEYYDKEQQLVSAWDSAEESPKAAEALSSELSGLLDAAGYTPVTMQELDEVLATESMIPLRLEVDLDDYDEMLIYRRGARTDVVEVKKFAGLKTESKEITVDDRVIIHTRVKSQAWFEGENIDPADRNLVPGSISLKQFQDVPRADLEMLLPSTQVKFRLIDSLMIGIPAFAGGVVVLATKLLATLGLVLALAGAWVGVREEAPDVDEAAMLLLFGGIIAIGSFIMKQFVKMKNRKVDYLKTLSENLYFRTLANGTGVVHSLLSAAEQQEVTEVLLGYSFLAEQPAATISELDMSVEAWLEAESGIPLDFDVEDSVAKLRALGVLHGTRRLRVLPLPESLELLDERWDSIFRYSEDAKELPSLLGATARSPLVRLRRVVGKFRGGTADRRILQD